MMGDYAAMRRCGKAFSEAARTGRSAAFAMMEMRAAYGPNWFYRVRAVARKHSRRTSRYIAKGGVRR